MTIFECHIIPQNNIIKLTIDDKLHCIKNYHEFAILFLYVDKEVKMPYIVNIDQEFAMPKFSAFT